MTEKADFTGHAHPVLAVSCPTCGAFAGTWCRRPSGHRASELHADRKRRADEVFIHQHGASASIERRADGWYIDPVGFVEAEAEQLPLF